MANDIIQAQYEQLVEISKRFENQVDVTTALRDRILQHMDALKSGGWEGKGSEAFFAEMEKEVSPAIVRLIDAFKTAQSVTLEAKHIIQEAEELAAQPFKNGQANKLPPSPGQSKHPYLVATPPGSFDKRRSQYSIGKPILVKDHTFRSGKADALRYDVTIGNKTIPVYLPAKTSGNLHIHSEKEIAKALAAMPEANRQLINVVNVNPGPNPDDAFWAKKYNNPQHRSHMTAGASGEINIYPTPWQIPQHDIDGSMLHETGHIWSQKNWGVTTDDKRWDEWKSAIQNDSTYVSDYAKSSPEEDFGETLKYYHLVVGTEVEAAARKSMPARFKIIDEIVAGKR